MITRLGSQRGRDVPEFRGAVLGGPPAEPLQNAAFVLEPLPRQVDDEPVDDVLLRYGMRCRLPGSTSENRRLLVSRPDFRRASVGERPSDGATLEPDFGADTSAPFGD